MSAGRTAAVAAKPVIATAATIVAAPAKTDDADEELRRFQAEMAQLDADPADDDRPGTPECVPPARQTQFNILLPRTSPATRDKHAKRLLRTVG